MVKSVIFEEYGEADKLQSVDLEINIEPQQDHVLVNHSFIGVNDIDILNRNGSFNLPNGKKICGYEAVGIVEQLGPNVQQFAVGDRVAYATAPMGSYTQKRSVHKDYLIKVPENISDQQVSSSLFKGLLGHYLTKRAFITNYKTLILIHDAANVSARAILSFALESGAPVIATVRNETEKSLFK